ncbi:hypothetical protein ACFLU6_16565 [Acidobacteriota bacterium]
MKKAITVTLILSFVFTCSFAQELTESFSVIEVKNGRFLGGDKLFYEGERIKKHKDLQRIILSVDDEETAKLLRRSKKMGRYGNFLMIGSIGTLTVASLPRTETRSVSVSYPMNPNSPLSDLNRYNRSGSYSSIKDSSALSPLAITSYAMMVTGYVLNKKSRKAKRRAIERYNYLSANQPN